MNIVRANFVGHVSSSHVDIGIEIVGDGVEFSTLWKMDFTPAEDGSVLEYNGKRFTDANGVEYGVYNTLRFDCSDLRDNSQWGDVAAWHVYATEANTLYLANAYAETFSAKTPQSTYSSLVGSLPVAILYVPWNSSTITDVSIALNIDEDSKVICGDGVTVSQLQGNLKDWRASMIPSIEITGQSSALPDEVVTLTATVSRLGSVATECDSELCLETTGGFLPLQRVKLTNGVATFNVVARYLTSGDTFKVKAGFRNYSGLGSKQITVS